MSMKSKTVLITGASRGIGREIARQFALEGANLAICSRSMDELRLVVDDLKSINPGSEIFALETNVADYGEAKRFVELTIERFGAIDCLVANAGGWGPMGRFDQIPWEEWSNAVDVNLKGVALVCKFSIPSMINRKKGKIIILSGGGATKPMENFSSYAASKSAVVRFAETIAVELKVFGIDVNTLAPGACNTKMLEEVLDAGPEKVGSSYYNQSLKQKESGGASLERAASLCTFLASEKSDGITGKLISAVWDPWQELDAHLTDLKDSDIYTLRRIIPADRGLNWSEVN